MALSLGELFGTIDLDASAFDKKLAGAQKDLKDWGKAGAGIAAGAAVAIGVALGAGIVSNLNIDAGNQKLAAQMALTEEQSAKAGKAAGAVYAANYGESMEQVQQATGAVMSSIGGMKDASEADLEDITAKVLNLANTFDVDLAEASATAGSLMKNGLAKDADEAMDLLTGSMQKVPEAMRGELLPIMDEYGKHFAGLGIDGETAMGMIVASSADGAIGMDKMGDALKEFTIRGTDMSKSTIGAYDALGLSSEQMTADLLAGGDTAEGAMAQIVHGLQGVEDPADQAALSLALFGTPLEDLGTDQIPNFLGMVDPMGDAFDDTAGAADRMADTLATGPAAGFDAFKRQAHAGLIDVVNTHIMPAVTTFADFLSTEVGPAITTAADWITNDMMPALKGFGDWFGENKTTITIWASVLGAVLFPIFARIVVELAIQVAAWVTAGAASIKTAALYIINSYKMVAAWARMGAAAIVSGAQTAYVWLLYRIEAAKSAVAMAVQAAKVVASWVVMQVGAVVNGAKIAAVWTAQIIASAARGAAAMAVQAAKFVVAWVVMATGATVNAVKMAAGWVVGVLIPAVGGVIAMGIAAASVVASWVLMGVQAMAQAVRMAAAWFIALGPIGWVILAVVGLVALIIANWDKISTFTSEAWTNIVRFVTEAWENIKRGVSEGTANVIQFFKDLPGNILGALGDLGGLLLGAGGQILDGFLTGLENGFEAVKNFVGGIGTWIAENKGPKAYDLKLLVPAGGWIMDGLEKGIENSMPSLGSTLGDVSWMVANGIDPEVTGSGNYAYTGSGSGATTPGAGAGAGVTVQVQVTEADNGDETARRVLSRVSQALAQKGIRLGELSPA